MSSCPTASATAALSRVHTARPVLLADLTVRDQLLDRPGLLEALGEVPDPRDPRGIRYRLASLLAVAVCAVVAGAVTYAAIGDWLDDLPDGDLPALGLPHRPAATTVWRLLVRIDSAALTQALARWLLTRVPLAGTTNRTSNGGAGGGVVVAGDPPNSWRTIAFDGKTVRGTVAPDGTCTHLLSAYDVATGITLAQLPLQAKGGEIAQVKPLVEQVEGVIGTVAGCVFVADALHAQKIHTEDLTARGAALLVRVKANQPTLFDRLRSLPWAATPIGDRTRDHAHGRDETRTCQAMTVHLPGGLGFPHAAQAVRITRTRRITGTTKTTAKTTRETAYLIVTLPHERADAINLNRWAREEWTIENKSHWVRDMTLREDEQRARTGTGPAVFAALRNGAIGYHRTTGALNIARATRGAARRPSTLVHNLTSTATTTQ